MHSTYSSQASGLGALQSVCFEKAGREATRGKTRPFSRERPAVVPTPTFLEIAMFRLCAEAVVCSVRWGSLFHLDPILFLS